MNEIRIIDTTLNNVYETGLCGYKSPKRPGFPEKVDWIAKQFEKGLRIKSVVSEKTGTQGMIEYIPSEYCWRPVDAKGYMFIHCLFVGFKKDYKNKGYAGQLIDICEQDARNSKMKGVAIVTRKGSFMVNKEIFLKRGYEVVDTAPSDFELLCLKYDKNASSPEFNDFNKSLSTKYAKGLTIIRAPQCPYTVKNVNEIVKIAENEFQISPTVETIKNHSQAQESPCAFGVFCIVYNGQRISEHPISATRFRNIMQKLV